MACPLLKSICVAAVWKCALVVLATLRYSAQTSSLMHSVGEGKMASIDVLQLGVIPHLVEKCLCADFLCKQSWRPHSDIFMACFQLIISVQASYVDFLQLRLGVLSFWRKLLFGCALLNFVPQVLPPAFSMISKAMFIRLPLIHKAMFCWHLIPVSCVHKDDFS